MIVVHGGYNDYYIFHSQSSQQRAADPSRWNMVRRDYDPFDTNSPLLWTPLVTPEARSQALRDNKGCCSSCHGIDHSFKHCPQYLISGGGYLNPQLGQLLLGDNGDACRRWQQRMRSRRCHVNPIGGGNTHTHWLLSSNRRQISPDAMTITFVVVTTTEATHTSLREKNRI